MDQKQRKPIGNIRIPASLAALLLLFFSAGAIYGIWRLVQSEDRPLEVVTIGPQNGVGMNRRGAPATNPVDRQFGRVFKREDGRIRAITDNYILLIGPQASPREMELRYANSDDWLSREQRLVLKVAQRAERGNATTQPIKLTDEQRRQMQKVSADPALPLADADRARLDTLTRAWESATEVTRPAAQKALLLAVREIARKNLPAGRDQFVANVNKFNSMLSPQQLEQYRQISNSKKVGKPAPPAAKPEGA